MTRFDVPSNSVSQQRKRSNPRSRYHRRRPSQTVRAAGVRPPANSLTRCRRRARPDIPARGGSRRRSRRSPQSKGRGPLFWDRAGAVEQVPCCARLRRPLSEIPALFCLGLVCRPSSQSRKFASRLLRPLIPEENRGQNRASAQTHTVAVPSDRQNHGAGEAGRG